MSKILALLAKLPAGSAKLDGVALAVAALALAGVYFGVISAADLPALVDAALVILPAVGLRAASLWSKGKLKAAAGEGAALAELVAKARAGEPVSAEALDHALQLVLLAHAGPPKLELVE